LIYIGKDIPKILGIYTLNISSSTLFELRVFQANHIQLKAR